MNMTGAVCDDEMEAAAEAETESDSTRSPNAEAAEHEERRQGGWQKQRRGRPPGNKIWDGWSGSWVEMPTDEGAAAQMPPAGSSDDMGIELSDAASALPSAAVGSVPYVYQRRELCVDHARLYHGRTSYR